MNSAKMNTFGYPINSNTHISRKAFSSSPVNENLMGQFLGTRIICS